MPESKPPVRASNFMVQAEAAKKMMEAIKEMTSCILCGGKYELKEDLGSIKVYVCTTCKVEATVS